MKISIKSILSALFSLLALFVLVLFFMTERQNRVREEVIDIGRQALELSREAHALGGYITEYSEDKSVEALDKWSTTLARVEKQYASLLLDSGLSNVTMINRVTSDISRIRTQFHLLQTTTNPEGFHWVKVNLDTYNQNLIMHLDTLVTQVQEVSYNELEKIGFEQKLVAFAGLPLVFVLFTVIYFSLVTPLRVVKDAIDSAERHKRSKSYKNSRIAEWVSLDSSIEELRACLESTMVDKKELESEVHRRRLAEDKATTQARTDHLTGLPNRRAVTEVFDQELLSSSELGLLFIDVDNFKSVNDSLGHKLGDQLLAQLGALITGFVGDRGLVARLGGDEFVVLYRGSKEATESFSRYLRGSLSEPIVIEENRLKISISIGVAHSPEHGTDINELLACADIAMFHAKKSAGESSGVCVFNERIYQVSREKFELTQYLKFALEQDKFEVWFQPQVSAKSGAVVGFESLLRLNNDGSNRTIGPAEFVPILEESGDIIDVGKLVVEEAIAFREELESKGHDIKVSINVSAIQLESDTLFNLLKGYVQDGTMVPEHFPLELTETAIIKNKDVALMALGKLRELGFSLQLDDFGTGNASLDLLISQLFDTVKIDKSFTLNEERQSNATAVIKAISHLSHELGFNMILEGVEQIGHLELAQRNHIEICQGFLYSRAMPSAEAKKWLAKRGNVVELFTAKSS